MTDNSNTMSEEEKLQAEIALIRLLRCFSVDLDADECYPKIRMLLQGGMLLEDLTLLARLFQKASEEVSFNKQQALRAQKMLRERFLSASSWKEQQALRSKLVGTTSEWEWRLVIGDSPALNKFFAARFPLDEAERRELAEQFCPIPDGEG